MPRRYYLVVTLATLVGTFLRLWQLTEVPPGLHYDLAATALLGNQVAFDGFRPIFITAYTGHEVLYYYWLAAWFNLAGSSVFTLRLAAAMLGVLAIPATFFAVREALRGEALSFQLAALAAVFIAFAFFHLVFSRFGFRVIIQPVVQCLALGFLFRGLWRLEIRGWGLARSGWHFALAGLFTGLTAYTYLAARLFPFPLAVFWLVLLVGLWRSTRRLGIWLRAFGVFALCALLAFAPLGLYFVQHPDDFFNRASQVVTRPGEMALLWQGVRRAAEMLVSDGEPYDRFNLPGLPLFAFPLNAFFILGLLITLYHFAQSLLKRNDPLTQSPNHSIRRATEALLLVWLPFMLLPTALSVHDIFPSNVRAFGVIPLLFAFPARGLAAAFQWIQRRAPGPLFGSPYPLTIIALITLGLGAVNTTRDYFGTWANLPSQRLNNDADLTGIAEFLNRQGLDPTRITPYVTSIHYRHPTLAYLARDFGQVQWLTGGTSLAFSADRAALIFSAASAPLPEAWTAGWEPYLIHEQRGADNRPEFRAYRFAPGQAPPLPAFAPLNENFGQAIFLTGYRIRVDQAIVSVDVRWQIENPVAVGDFLPYARLYDAEGRWWAQSENFTYPSEQWRAGDTLLTRLTVPLPLGLPPGAYTVKVGLFSQSASASLPRLDAQGGFGGERAVLGALQLAGRAEATPEAMRAAHTLTAPAINNVQGDLQLLGYQLSATSWRQNERFELRLFWHARTPTRAPLRLSLGEQMLWMGEVRVDQALMERYTLRLPLDAPPGSAELRVSVSGFGEAVLTPVEVVSVLRTFTAPDAATRVDARFQDQIALTGYTLVPGPATHLTLVWQSQAESLAIDYTVFVHLRDAAGNLVAQADRQPRAGAYPTSLWASGEYIADEFQFDLAPGEYTLSVGLYNAETGARLQVRQANEGVSDQVILGSFTVP